MNRLLTTLATVTALAGLAPTAWAEGPKDQPRPAARLASFDDLQKRLNDPTLRLLDATRPSGDKSVLVGGHGEAPDRPVLKGLTPRRGGTLCPCRSTRTR